MSQQPLNIKESMVKIYLVGGAIRDELLGLTVTERDWVVIGATPKLLEGLGYKPVGKDFPVFLHPLTNEEYALARTERKVAKGYKGFKFYYAPDVTLQQDLMRRDLTINAMARSEEGQLFDPFSGQQDLKARWLRHVSPAFAEDPVRILRVARFASKLPDFKVHSETNLLMQTLVNNGEVDALVAERVWQEFEKSFAQPQPVRLIEVLNDCGALEKLMPHIKNNTPAIKALIKATAKTKDPIIRFCALMHTSTPKELTAYCKRYRVPNQFAEPAALVCNYLEKYQILNIKNADGILSLLKSLDTIRRPSRLIQFLQICDICCNDSHLQKSIVLQQALDHIKRINTQPLQQQQLVGKQFANALHELQLKKVEEVIN